MKGVMNPAAIFSRAGRRRIPKVFTRVGCLHFIFKKKRYKLSALVTPRQSALLRTLWTLVRVPQLLNSCLFAGMAFARVIVLNIRKPNGVSCPGFAPRLFFQAAGLRYSVQKWNARPGASTSVLLPLSHLFKGLPSQLSRAIVNGFVIPL